MTLVMFKDNRLPLLEYTVTSDGLPVDLSSSTAKLQMRPVGSAVLKVDTTATIVDAVAGEVAYAWAASDTDTVGVYDAWFRVTTGGKDQDTPEFEIAIVEHAPLSVVVPNPVALDGSANTVVYAGDAYLASVGRALTYQVQIQDAPDLTGLSFVYHVKNKLSKAMTLVGEDALTVDLTSTETGTTIGIGVHRFAIEATVSVGNIVTLVAAELQVLDPLSMS